MKSNADLSLDDILNWLRVGVRRGKKYIVVMLLLLWQGCKLQEDGVMIKGLGKVVMTDEGRKLILELEKGFWEEIFKKPLSVKLIKDMLD